MYVEDLRRIAASPQLRYPVATKADFVALLAQEPTVVFRGTPFDSKPAAELVPDFFFPVTSAEDLVRKASELVATRGLAGAGPLREAARPHGGPRSGVRTVEGIGADVEAVVTDPSMAPTDQERIDALDIVTHALEFVGHPQALDLWRDAATGCYRAETRAAVATMLQHVTAVIKQGDYDAVTRICDCLFDLYDLPAPAHVAGRQIEHSPGPRARAGATPTKEMLDAR